MAFACYLLAHPRNAGKQATLAAEIDAFGRERKPTIADLDQLPYLDAVLKESMRLFPPGHTTGRVAERDMDLGGGCRSCDLTDLISYYAKSLYRSISVLADAVLVQVGMPELGLAWIAKLKPVHQLSA